LSARGRRGQVPARAKRSQGKPAWNGSFVAIVVAVVLYGVVTYNGLVSLRQRVTQAFADIDVQLKQRHDLIPNLVRDREGLRQP
jgi:hypothetical protein